MSSNPVLPQIATVLGAAVTEAYLLAAQPPAGRAPVPPVGWKLVGNPLPGYIRLNQTWEKFGLWYQSTSDSSAWLLALRGTVTKADGEVDADTDPTQDFVPFASGVTVLPTPKVHSGFYHLYTDTDGSSPSMQAQIFAILQPLVQSKALSTLYITGHSLGGALAELVSLDVALSGWTAVQAQTITFAAPMVGIADNWGLAYSSHVSSSFAVVNQYDVVPTQPNLPGWGTVGSVFDLLFFHNQNDFSEAEMIVRHSMSNHLFVLQQLIGLTPQQWAGTFADSITVGVTDTSQLPSAENIAVAQSHRPPSSGSLVAP